jgi:hypothetical protein
VRFISFFDGEDMQEPCVWSGELHVETARDKHAVRTMVSEVWGGAKGGVCEASVGARESEWERMMVVGVIG